MKFRSSFAGWLLSHAAVLAVFFGILTASKSAHAAPGTFKLKSTEATEVSGAWHIYATIELPKAPATAHQSMRFIFTKTAVYERTLVDGHSEPVMNKTALQNQSPTSESQDVDFADPSGKIFKGTRFDFGLTRARGYEAGEYKVELRTADGISVGGSQNLVLKGDNPVVDRRSMSFNAKEPSIKKVGGVDAGAKRTDDGDPGSGNVGGTGEVAPMGTATPFVPPEGHQHTDEEEIKTRPKGCGCAIPGQPDPDLWLFVVPLAGLAAIAVRRRRAA